MPYKIFVDAGHNPRNPNAGAEGNGYREQDITYDVATRLAALLNANPDFEAKLSRDSPEEVLGTSNLTSLKARTDAANAWGADFFISIHTNASSNPTASGCEGYAFSRSSAGFAFGEEIVSSLSESTGLQNRGMFVRPSLYVLRKTAMPSVLIEIGFITNPNDADLMVNSPDLFSDDIYRGILNYYGY